MDEQAANTTTVNPESGTAEMALTIKVIYFSGLLITLAGFVLNCFCFLAVKNLPESSGSTLMKYLAVWDSMAVLEDGILRWGLELLGINLAVVHEILCYMFNMFSWSTNAGATYTVIAMALNRVVAIKAPFWYNNNVSSTTAHKISLAVLIFAGAMGSQALAFYRLDKTRGCTWFSSLNAAFVMAFVNTAVFFFIPIVVLVVSDLIFVRGLAERTSKSLSSGARGAPTKDAATLERERQKESRAREYTIFLICLTISYLVCYLGVVIFSSMAGWGAAYGDLLRVISKLFVIVNNSKNFIFYYMSGDAFRSAFKQVLRSSK